MSECAATEQQAGALVLLHPLVPHGFVPCAEAQPGTGAQDAARHDDVLQQVLVQERDVSGLGHVPAAAATPHRRPDGENRRASSRLMEGGGEGRRGGGASQQGEGAQFRGPTGPVCGNKRRLLLLPQLGSSPR